MPFIPEKPRARVFLPRITILGACIAVPSILLLLLITAGRPACAGVSRTSVPGLSDGVQQAPVPAGEGLEQAGGTGSTPFYDHGGRGLLQLDHGRPSYPHGTLDGVRLQHPGAAGILNLRQDFGDGKGAAGVSPGEASRMSGDWIVVLVLVLLVVLILLILLILLLIRPARDVVSTFFRFRPAGPRETESTAAGRSTGGRRTGEDSAVSALRVFETLKAATAELLMQDMEQGANVLKVWLRERGPEAAEKHSGAGKAAIFLLALGERHAADIFAHLEPWEIARVSRVIMEMKPVPRATIEGVLEEFGRLLATGDSTLLGGPERVRRLLKGVEGDTAGYVLDALELDTGPKPLKSLEKVRPGVLAQILRDEHPQTQALILVHLDSEQAAGLLQRLAPSVRADVLVRLARLESVSEEMLREVDKVLERRILAVSGKKGRKAGGLGAAAAILDALDRDMEKEILTEIEGLSAQLAAEIRQGTGK